MTTPDHTAYLTVLSESPVRSEVDGKKVLSQTRNILEHSGAVSHRADGRTVGCKSV